MPATLLIALLAGPPVPASHFVPELKTDLGPHEHRVAFLHTTGFSGERRFEELTTGSPNAWGQDFLQHRRDFIGRWLQDESRMMDLQYWHLHEPDLENKDAWAELNPAPNTHEGRRRSVNELIANEGRRRSVRELMRKWKVAVELKIRNLIGVTVDNRQVSSKSLRATRASWLEEIRGFLLAEVKDIYDRRRKDVAWIRENGPVTFTMRNGLDWRFPPGGDKRYSPGQARTILREKTFVVLSAEGVREVAEELRGEIDGVERQVEKIPDLLVRDPDVKKLNDLIDERVEDLVKQRVDAELASIRSELAALKRQAAGTSANLEDTPAADSP